MLAYRQMKQNENCFAAALAMHRVINESSLGRFNYGTCHVMYFRRTRQLMQTNASEQRSTIVTDFQ